MVLPSAINKACVVVLGKFLEVMRHQNRCDVRVRVVERVHRLQELFAGGHVQPRRGLVEKQQSGIRDQGSRNECAAAFALRQRGPVIDDPAPETDGGNHRVGPFEVVLARCPTHRDVDRRGDAGQHDFAHRQRILQSVTGIDVPDGVSQSGEVDAPHLFTEHLHRPRGRKGHGRTESQQGALARAVRPKQRPVLARADGQGYAVDDLLAVAAERDVRQLQHGLRHAD